MTSLRWDKVPKPRVERPPLLAPSSKSARRKQKQLDLKDPIEEVGGTRTELQDLSRSARAAARAASAEGGSEPVLGVQGPRRHAVAGCGPSGVRQLPRGDVGGVSPVLAAGVRPTHSARPLAQVSVLDLRARLPLARSAWRYYGTFSASSTRRRRSGTPGGDDFGLSGHAGDSWPAGLPAQVWPTASHGGSGGRAPHPGGAGMGGGRPPPGGP